MANKREKQKQGKTDNVVYLLLRKIIAGKDTEINALRDRIIQLEKEIEQLKSGNRNKTNIQSCQKCNAAAALAALFTKKKKSTPIISPIVQSTGNPMYEQIFKKYEKMMQMGINVHGAVGRMRQDGIDKKAIAAFEKKHNAYGEEDEKVDPKSLGLRVKKEVPVSKGIKMKRLHWDPTNVKLVKGSIWEDLDESTIRYDRKHFELHFQVRQRKPVDEQKVSKQQAKAGQIITFVSKKRTQGVLIGLKNLGLQNEELKLVLHNMDEKIMTVDTLSKLLEMAPTMDEQTEAEKKIMQQGTRRVKDYGTVEQFFFTLCDFYNLHQRLKLWMFKQNFFDICDSLLDQYKTIGKACDKIRNNKNLRLLLTIILTFGNHMNSGTRKGQVYGFDLTILNNLTAVKSFDNTRSLSMYIYEFCDRKYPSALKILDELRDTLKAASSMEIETLKQAYERIQANMKEIKNLITSDEIENYDMDDRFIMVLTKFHKRATPKMKKFNMTVGNVMVSTKRVMKKFSYGSEQTPQTIESFFQIWWKFVQDFSTSKEKLILLEKERQKRIAKRKKMRDKQMKKKMHNKYKQNKTLPEDSGMQKGSTLHKEFEKRRKFDEKKGALHGKLRGHVKQRSIFIANGGKIDDKSADVNNTMRRLSSMYQDTQSQAKAMEDARKKAAILKYNKFKLPNMNQQTKRKWNIQEWEKQPFNIPDSKPMVAPKGNPQRNTQPMPNGNKVNKPNYSIKPKKNGGVVPPPPSGPVPPHQQQQNNNNYYGNNPQASWANQQQQLGYGSNPNLSYQQYQQQQQQPNNSYQQQQRQQYGMQKKKYIKR
eukprot:426264_1